ncbi:MAG: hypothetical protein ACKVS6_00030 [Planctomycetota bacterium]
MTLRSISLLFAGAVLAIGVSCKSNTTNTNATAEPCKTECTDKEKADCAAKCEKEGSVNANATKECPMTGAKKDASINAAATKECPTVKSECSEKKEACTEGKPF